MPTSSSTCRHFLAGVSLLVLGGWLPAARAYNLNNRQWSDGPIALSLSLGSAGRTLSDGNTSWDDVAKRAASEWNAHLGLVQLAPVIDGGAAQQGDGKNTVAFSNTIYGDEFGDETIAVTLLHYTSDTAIGETDVLVNTQDTFDSYDGPLRDPGTGNDLDLHRVLLHEFGHVLGLEHPDAIHQNVVAVMNSVVSDTDQLTDDDLGGVLAIYGDPNLRSVKLAASDLAVDDRRGKIFVSTTNGKGNGSVKVVDPYLATKIGSVRTGAKPNVLRISGGGEHLYLGVDGPGVIDQIDPDTLAITQEFALGAQAGVAAADIAVLPGAPESLLVSQVGNTLRGGNSGDFAVYDHGIQRPEEAFGGSVGSPIALDDSGSVFYGIDGFHETSGTISKFTLEAGGVSPHYVYNYETTDGLDNAVDYSEGFLYTEAGQVYNLGQGAYAGVFPDVAQEIQAYALHVDPTLGQAYYAIDLDTAGYEVFVDNLTTHARIGVLSLPRYSRVLKMRRWGANGLVMALEGKEMLLLRSSLIAPGSLVGPLATVSLGSPNRPSIDEDATLKSKLTVTRTGDDLSTPLAVYYTITGTAVNGADLQPLSGEITIPTGQATAKIKVVPGSSHFGSGTRTVQITLTSASGSYRLEGAATGTVLLTSGQP